MRVSKYRPRQPIIAVTPVEEVVGRLSLAWGILPVKMPASLGLEEVFEQAVEAVMLTETAGKGDLIIITAGLPLTVPGSTNLVKAHKI